MQRTQLDSTYCGKPFIFTYHSPQVLMFCLVCVVLYDAQFFSSRTKKGAIPTETKQEACGPTGQPGQENQGLCCKVSRAGIRYSSMAKGCKWRVHLTT